MSFVQPEFLIFFALVFGTYWAMSSYRRVQNALLAVASAVFYGWVHPWFLGLLYFSAILDYFMALAIERAPKYRRMFLIISITGNLGVLGVFKYLGFFVENVADLMLSLGLQPGITSLSLILPVGISFYTFQTLSYTIDVYRGNCRARRSFLDVLVFVSFFPQLVAGPIERARFLLPQVERRRTFDLEQVLSGFSLALWGGFKKVAIADSLAPYVDKVFALEGTTAPLIWTASFAFSIQIFADFSGYTDMARGTARMLGFQLSENFRRPFLARSPGDFWMRWHISFTLWLRDYVYIPMGGLRGSFSRITVATSITLMASAVWHGATWNFILCGLYHIVLLTAYRGVQGRLPLHVRRWRRGAWAAVPLMFLLNQPTWLMFREPEAGQLLHWLTLSPWVATPDQWVAVVVLLTVCALLVAPMLLALAIEHYVVPRVRGTPWMLPARTTAWTALILGIITFMPDEGQNFIYFQF